ARATVIELANAAGTRGGDGGPLSHSVAAGALTAGLLGLNRRYQIVAGLRLTRFPEAQPPGCPMSRPASLSDDLARNPPREQALALVACPLEELLRAAARRRDAAHGSVVSYSRKVFIPLTQLCRDVCHYCTFAHPPRKNERAYLPL